MASIDVMWDDNEGWVEMEPRQAVDSDSYTTNTTNICVKELIVMLLL